METSRIRILSSINNKNGRWHPPAKSTLKANLHYLICVSGFSPGWLRRGRIATGQRTTPDSRILMRQASSSRLNTCPCCLFSASVMDVTRHGHRSLELIDFPSACKSADVSRPHLFPSSNFISTRWLRHPLRLDNSPLISGCNIYRERSFTITFR